MLTLTELQKWVGITPFELLLHFLAFFFSSVLLALKLIGENRSVSYWHIFTPLFIASVLNLYFLFIIFIRTIVETRQFKNACVRSVISYFSFWCFKLQFTFQRFSSLDNCHFWSFVMSQNWWWFWEPWCGRAIQLWSGFYANLAVNDHVYFPSLSNVLKFLPFSDLKENLWVINIISNSWFFL